MTEYFLHVSVHTKYYTISTKNWQLNIQCMIYSMIRIRIRIFYCQLRAHKGQTIEYNDWNDWRHTCKHTQKPGKYMISYYKPQQ